MPILIVLPPVSRELSVPITGYLNPETDRVVVVAFAMTCAAIRLQLDDNLKLLIASKIIEIAKAGETNLDRLCERALIDLRGQDAEPHKLVGDSCESHGKQKTLALGISPKTQLLPCAPKSSAAEMFHRELSRALRVY